MNKVVFNIFFLVSSIMVGQVKDLVNAEKKIGMDNWTIVNDDVMGGVSTSNLSLNDQKNLINFISKSDIISA